MGVEASHEKRRHRGRDTDHFGRKRQREGMEDLESSKRRKVDAEAMVEHSKMNNRAARKRMVMEGLKKKRRKHHEKVKQSKKRKRQNDEDLGHQHKKQKRDCSKKAMKRKRKRTEHHQSQAKEPKRQDKEGRDSQASKRKESQNEPAQKESRGQDGEEVLQVEVEAERVSKEERNVSRHCCCVQISKDNLVEADVRGHPCLVFLDSGATLNHMALSLAQSMGLITGHEETVKTRVITWKGDHVFDVIKLADVEVVLRGGVTVNTPMMVYPNEMERACGDSQTILLSMGGLLEAELRQEFHLDGSSSLFMRHPERLQRPHRYGTDAINKVFTFAARTPGTNEPLKVLMDTGGYSAFYATKTGLDTAWPRRPPPRLAKLQFDSSTHVRSGVVSKQVSAFFHFAIGRKLLSFAGAVINYADSSLTLRLNTQEYRTNIRQCSPPQ